MNILGGWISTLIVVGWFFLDSRFDAGTYWMAIVVIGLFSFGFGIVFISESNKEAK
jgi:hypothetical protein